MKVMKSNANTHKEEEEQLSSNLNRWDKNKQSEVKKKLGERFNFTGRQKDKYKKPPHQQLLSEIQVSWCCSGEIHQPMSLTLITT